MLKGKSKGGSGVLHGVLEREVSKETIVIEELEPRDEEKVRRGEPGEELEEVSVGMPEQNRTVKIRAAAPKKLKEELWGFLRKNTDVLGIGTKVAANYLNIDPEARPVKQKQRNFASERNNAVAAEAEKLVKARFIREVQYPSWLSNVVMVRKSNDKWMMCVDFTDLNKPCPKDSFSLPTIDFLVCWHPIFARSAISKPKSSPRRLSN